MKTRTRTIVVIAFAIVFVVLTSYAVATSDTFSFYIQTGIFLPKSAVNIIDQENQNWMGNGDQVFSFTASREDLEQLVARPLKKNFLPWQKGPWGKERSVPTSQWIDNVQAVENTDQIFYSTENTGPKNYEASEYILVIVDFKSLKVIVFQHNA